MLDSPVGPLTLVATEHGLRAVLWPDDDPRRVRLPDTPVGADHPIVVATVRQLEGYFAGERTAFDLALDLTGTDFQLAVWTELGRIPFGETATYTEIARRVGRPRAARAVGAANGRNPVSIVLPCHRVVGSDGDLTGFAGGLPTKRWLLAHEAHHAGS